MVPVAVRTVIAVLVATQMEPKTLASLREGIILNNYSVYEIVKNLDYVLKNENYSRSKISSEIIRLHYSNDRLLKSHRSLYSKIFINK